MSLSPKQAVKVVEMLGEVYDKCTICKNFTIFTGYLKIAEVSVHFRCDIIITFYEA